MFGLDPVHAHVGRELWARDHDGLVLLEPQQAEKLLGGLDVSHHNRDVVEGLIMALLPWIGTECTACAHYGATLP